MNTKVLTPPLQLLLLWLGCLPNLGAGHQRNLCFSDNLPVVLLKRDKETGEFSLFQRLNSDKEALALSKMGAGQFRHLETSDYVTEGELETETPSLRGTWQGVRGLFSSKPRQVEEFQEYEGDSFVDFDRVDEYRSENSTEYGDDLFYAHECTCFSYEWFEESTMYCPFTTTACRETIDTHHSSTNDYVRTLMRCETPLTTMQTTGSMAMMYMILTAYMGCFITLFSTHKGRSALSLIPELLTCGRWNRWQADRILNSNRPLAAQMLWTHHRIRNLELQLQAYREIMRRRREGGMDNADDGNTNEETTPTEQRRPTSLVLKTRTYQTNKIEQPTDQTPDNDEDMDEHECIICMAPLMDGDRVGSLPCSHVFHVSCLKPWLQRTNNCPLCKKEGLAVPRYDEEKESDSETYQQSTTDTDTDSQAQSYVAQENNSEENSSSQ